MFDPDFPQYCTFDINVWRYATYGSQSITAEDIRSWVERPANPAQDLIGSCVKHASDPRQPLRIVITDSIAKQLDWQLRRWAGWTKADRKNLLSLIAGLVEDTGGLWLDKASYDAWEEAKQGNLDPHIQHLDHEDTSVVLGARKALQVAKQKCPMARGVLVTDDKVVTELRRWTDLRISRLYKMAGSLSGRNYQRTGSETWQLIGARTD